MTSNSLGRIPEPTSPMFHASLSTPAQPPPASPPECRPLSEQKVMEVGVQGPGRGALRRVSCQAA